MNSHDKCEMPLWLREEEEVLAIGSDEDWVCWVDLQVKLGNVLDGKLCLVVVNTDTNRRGVSVGDATNLTLEDQGEDF